MIKVAEWDSLVNSYRNSRTPLAYKGDFGRGFLYNKSEQNKIEKKYKISFGAYCILGSYAGKGCFELNTQLREDVWIECDDTIQIYSDLLNRALDELPGFNNNVCYRWSNMPGEGYKYLKKFVGKTIMMPQFWSTSFKKVPASDQFFEIHTDKLSNGRYIAGIVGKPSEEEILFKSRTLFEIIGYNKDTIYLEELNATNYDLRLHEDFWRKDVYSERVHKKLFPQDCVVSNRKNRILPDF